MIFRLFQTNRLFGYIVSYLLTVFLLFFSFSNFEVSKGSLLYHLFGNTLSSQIFLFSVIVLSLPHSFIRFLSKHQIHKKSIYFQYFLYLLLTFPLLLKTNVESLIIVPILIAIVDLIFETYNKSKANVEIVQIGMLSGFLMLLKTETIFLIPFMIIGLAVFRSFVLKDIFQLLLCTVIVPLLFYGFDLNNHLGIHTRFSYDMEGLFNFTKNFPFYLPLIPAFFFSLISFFNLLRRVNYLAIKQQLYRYVFIWLGIFSLLLMFLEDVYHIGVYTFALAAIVPLNYYFKTIKSRFWSDVQIILVAIVATWLM